MAEFISVESDISEVKDLFGKLTKQYPSIQRRVMSGIGTSTATYIRKAYTESGIKKVTGNLRKSIKRRVISKGKAVSIGPWANAEKTKVFYGFAQAKGFNAEPKQKSYMKFQIDGKWVTSHGFSVTPKDFIEKPAKKYIGSEAYKARIDALLQREIDRIEKKGGTIN